MFSVAQEARVRKGSLAQTWSIIGLLLLAIFGFFFFNIMHPANAESFPTACDGKNQASLVSYDLAQCDGSKEESN